jgi:hypothetical protein
LLMKLFSTKTALQWSWVVANRALHYQFGKHDAKKPLIIIARKKIIFKIFITNSKIIFLQTKIIFDMADLEFNIKKVAQSSNRLIPWILSWHMLLIYIRACPHQALPRWNWTLLVVECPLY